MRRRRKFKPGTSPVRDHCGPTGKARYHSEGAAVEALRRIRLQVIADGDERHQERRIYKCTRHCGGWHLSKELVA